MIFTKKEHFKYEMCPYISVRDQAFDRLDRIYNNSDFTEGLNAYKNDNNERAHICFDRLVKMGVDHPILMLLHMLTEERMKKNEHDYVKRLFICADDYINDSKVNGLLFSDIYIWIQYELMKEFYIFLRGNLYLCEDIDRMAKSYEKLVYSMFVLDTLKENILWASATFASFLELFIMIDMKEAAAQAIFYSTYINGTVKTQFGEEDEFSKDVVGILEKAFEKIEGKTKFPYREVVKMHSELMRELERVRNLERTNPTHDNYARLKEIYTRLFLWEC